MMKMTLFIGCLLSFLITATFAQQKEKTPLDVIGGVIAFYSEKRDTHSNAEKYTMNADGSHPKPLVTIYEYMLGGVCKRRKKK